MNKTPYIVVAIIIFLIAAISVTTLLQNRSTETADSEVVYTDLDITFQNTDGEDVVTDNFLKDQSVKPDEQNPGMYFLGDTISIQPTTGVLPPFTAMYDKDTGSFNITLLQKPFGSSRQGAEIYLKNILKIEESAMCELKYMVTVPGYVDQNASGQDYRFSFCPDAVKL